MKSERSKSANTTKNEYKLVSEALMTVYDSEVSGPTKRLLNDACSCTGNSGCGGGGNWC